MIDLLMLGIMGRIVQVSAGNKYVYWLYAAGTLFGGLTSVAFQHPSPYIQPKIGPESAIAAYLGFIGMMNPFQTFYFFFFPIRAWVMMLMLGTYSLVFDPEKKYFAGLTAGITIFQMKRVGFI